MSASSRLLRAIELLPYGFIQLPTNEDEEEKLIRKILWKLGDSLPAPPAVEAHLQDLLELLQTSIDRSKPQVDRLALEGLRVAGVNLFVELESVLTQVVEFACWLLMNDHYGSDRTHRFRYSEPRSRQFANDVFGANQTQPTEFAWDKGGKNSLGVLIEAMRILAKTCEKTLGEEEKLARGSESTPFFASQPMFDFPFVHTALILDLDRACAERLIEVLRAAAGELERGKVADLRNRFSHSRDDIPSPVEVGEMCDSVSRAIDMLCGAGLVPSVYVFASSSSDAFGRSIIEMIDGKGRSISFNEPSELSFCDLPKSDEPQVIAAGAVLSGGIQFIRLRAEEDTEFTRQWANYQPGSSTSATPQHDGNQEGIAAVPPMAAEGTESPSEGRLETPE